MPSDDWLNVRELALVYYRRGRMAHLMAMREVNSRYGLGPLCNQVSRHQLPLGTGTQDEWEKARALPLCGRCKEVGGVITTVDDERRARGVPRTPDTPCAVDNCRATDYLVRVNPKGEPGIFMCPPHARVVG